MRFDPGTIGQPGDDTPQSLTWLHWQRHVIPVLFLGSIALVAWREIGNRFYNYKGLRSFNKKFHPEWCSAYLAYPVLTPLPPLLVDSAALIAGRYRRILFTSD